ncbi:MAG: hypothetical protein IPM24_00510 [Bryobacterales bacterium]|nr:hypothetical protein [Bryobacterales bacterium]
MWRVLSLSLLASCLIAAPPLACPGGNPIGEFQLQVKPGALLDPSIRFRPLTRVNRAEAGYVLRYEPGQEQKENGKGEIALALGPSDGSEVILLDAHPAGEAAEWTLPKRVRIVGVFWGPAGLNRGKMQAAVNKDPQLLVQLAEYADQTTQTEMLIRAIAQGQRQTITGQDMDSALLTFASRYGVTPRINRDAPPDQQTMALLRTLNPALSTYDPLASEPQVRMQQSAALAASVAGLFFGNTVGIAAGGAALFANLRTLMFPKMDLRSTFAQNGTAETVTLCARREAVQPRTRQVYVWATRLPDAQAPALELKRALHVPMEAASPLPLQAAGKDWPLLARVEDWTLRHENGERYKAPVKLDAAARGLEVDLRRTNLEPGVYQIEGRWDWESVRVGGLIHVHEQPNLSEARLTAESQDRLLAGRGRVPVTVEAPESDLQFIEKLHLRDPDERFREPVELPFRLPEGPRLGRQTRMETEIDTRGLRPGTYHLLLAQAGGRVDAAEIEIQAEPPTLTGLPLRLNLGETGQPLTLRGTHLDRIERIEADGVEFALEDGSAASRSIRATLGSGAERGAKLTLRLHVAGRNAPLTVAGGAEIAGPRPRIVAVEASLPRDFGIALKTGELPAQSFASFGMRVTHAAPTASVSLTCAESALRLGTVSVRAGEQSAQARLRLASGESLFLSFDPGAVGQAGCTVLGQVINPLEGASEPYELGRVVRAPRIETFRLTDEMLGDGAFAGVLEGQDLETIEKVGWDEVNGNPVASLPVPIADDSQKQRLRIALHWPSPVPHAPLYVWLRGEEAGRRTTARY